MNDNFPSNSKKSRNLGTSSIIEKPKTEIKSEVIKQESVITRFAKSFIQTDRSTIVEYLLFDIIEPTVKKTIFDSITGSLDLLLNKGERTYTNYNYSGNRFVNTVTSLNDPSNIFAYNKVGKKNSNQNNLNKLSVTHYRQLAYPTKQQAESVLQQMYEILEHPEFQLHVGDYYEISNTTPDQTAYDYGWISLEGSKVQALPDGRWTLFLPKAMPISKR